MTTLTFFKSKKFLIPVLILGLLTLGYFSWVNYSQNAQKISSQISSSSSSMSSTNQSISQSSFTGSNSQISSFSSLIQTNNSSIPSQISAETNSTSSQTSDLTNETSKSEKPFSQNNQIQPLVADNDHDVVVLEECDLAIRYKKSEIKKVYKENSSAAYKLFLESNKFKELSVLCSTSEYDSANNEEWQSWLITKYDKINTVALNFFESESKKFIASDFIVSSEKYKEYKFFGNQRYYNFDFANEDSKSIFQIQFNSLAPSTSSVKL